MDSNMKICPVCGSKQVVALDGDNKKYKCNSCDEIFEEQTSKVAAPKIQRRTSVGLTAKDVYKKSLGCIVEIMSTIDDSTLSGTGFYISEDGYLISNAHVIIGKNAVGNLTLSDKIYSSGSRSIEYSELEVIYLDAHNDLALLKANQKGLKHVALSDGKEEIGDKVYAIGNSKGMGLSLVDGIISDMDRTFNDHKVFMFTALVTNGCSGGPIFNDRGQVCGVTVGTYKDIAGMNFGIPIDIVKEFLSNAQRDKSIHVL